MPSDDYRTYHDAVNARGRGLGTGFDGIVFIFSPPSVQFCIEN